tara:strand:+ start:4833 stop:5048 length:216 start_codon:yes stop_codon:yes gene_type:complete
MIKKFFINTTTSILLLFMLCLGSQNLKASYQIDLGISKTIPMPIGFILGISFISGYFTGGNLLISIGNPKS